LSCALAAQAAGWSDTSMGFRTGNDFAELINARAIPKVIFNRNHVRGYKYGSNVFNADLLLSASKDPA
jgi:ribosomal protein L18